jgi:hypothetical protein
LNADNVIRVGRGGAATSSTSTAIAVTLDASGSTDADSVVFVGLWGEGLTFTTPAGWAVVQASSNGLSVFRRGPVEGLAAGESTWNFTPSATAGKAVVAGALEVSSIDPATTVDVIGTLILQTVGTGVSVSTGQVSTYDGLGVLFTAHRDSANATPVTWSGYNAARDLTGIGVAEILQQGQAGTGNSVALASTVCSVTSIASYYMEATVSRTPLSSTAPAVAVAFVLNAMGARHASDLFRIDGAEHGTITGNTALTLPGGAAGYPYKPLASVTAGVSISGGAARSGSYGWDLSSTAAACNWVGERVVIVTTGNRPAWRRCFNLRGDTTARRLWRITMTTTLAATLNVDITYNAAADNLLSCTIGTTTVYSDQVPPSSGWFAVDVRFDCSAHVAGASSTRNAEWTVDYDATLTDDTPGVTQTTASQTSSMSGTVSAFNEMVGWATSITSSLYSDDGGAAPGANYPIGDLRVLPLKVDPAGTPSISGTSTNFGVMTANGTIAAWNATNARNAVDDVPPDLSGTRDAAVAILAHATDYAEFPMETYDLAGNKVAARGVKFIGSVWAASATATTIRIFVYDGTTQYTIYAEADPDADTSATPKWIQNVVKSGSTPTNWTQAAVDALAVRFGSNDGNPDIGLDIMLIELAVIKARPETLFGEAPDVYVEAQRDPDTQALVGMTVNTPVATPVTIDYNVNGSPSSTGLIAAGSSQYVPLSSDGDVTTVTDIVLTPS